MQRTKRTRGLWSTAGMLAVASTSCGRTTPLDGDAVEPANDASSPLVDVADVHETSAADARETGDGCAPIEVGGPAPVEGEWVPFPCLPCSNMWIAKQPAVDLVDTWSPCTSSRAGCFRMETAWTTSLSGDKVLPIGSARRGADGAVAVYERSWPMSYSFEMAMDIVQSPKHMPVFGLLEEFRGGMAGKCTAGLHAGPLGMVAAARDPRSATTEHYIVFDYERPDVARDVFTLEPIQYVDAPGHSNRLTVGDRRLFLGTTEPAGVAVVDLGTHTVIRRVTATSPRVARPEAVRKGAIGTYAWSSGIAFIDDDGNVTTLLDPPSMFGAVKVDATTDDLVWLREETPGGPLVLWTAPFSSTAAALRPRRVTAFESTALSNYLEDAILVNDGYVLVKVNVLEMLLLRLSDGRGWTLAPEPEDQWAWPAFVDRDEVWIAVDKRGLTSRTLRTFVRLRIDAMGEPDVASR